MALDYQLAISIAVILLASCTQFAGCQTTEVIGQTGSAQLAVMSTTVDRASTNPTTNMAATTSTMAATTSTMAATTTTMAATTTAAPTTTTTTAVTTTSSTQEPTKQKHKSSGFKVSKQMMVGLAMGFSGFAIFLTIACCSWHWCCKMFMERKERNAPGDFRSGDADPSA